MIYISFDQATGASGYSVYEDRKLLYFGKFKCEGEFFSKVLETKKETLRLIKKINEDYPKEKIKVIFEDIQQQQNVETFKKLAQLQGTLIVAVMEEFGYQPDVYYASSWKAFSKVKGKNRAEQKRNAQAKVLELFGEKVTQDEADAILLGRFASHKEINW